MQHALNRTPHEQQPFNVAQTKVNMQEKYRPETNRNNIFLFEFNG